jgi:hypothetical protein
MSSERSSCYSCRSVFPTASITEFVDDGRTPLCPLCRIDAVLDGEVAPNRLQQLRYDMFGVLCQVLNGLHARDVVVVDFGPESAAWPEGEAPDGHFLELAMEGGGARVWGPRAVGQPWTARVHLGGEVDPEALRADACSALLDRIAEKFGAPTPEAR